MKITRKKKRILIWAVGVPLLAIGGFILFCNLWVILSTKSLVYDSSDKLKSNTIGLVLGTSKKTAPNRPNLHFENRLEAAAQLYRDGKVRHLLVSGDKDSEYYNEPRDMTAKLISLNIPEQAISADNSGYRTLDSVVRAKKIYNLDKVTIVSDGFHVNRALFVARKMGLDAVAYSSRPVSLKYSLKARARECLARVLVVLDLYVFDTQPEQLGDRISIVVSEAEADHHQADSADNPAQPSAGKKD